MTTTGCGWVENIMNWNEWRWEQRTARETYRKENVCIERPYLTYSLIPPSSVVFLAVFRYLFQVRFCFYEKESMVRSWMMILSFFIVLQAKCVNYWSLIKPPPLLSIHHHHNTLFFYWICTSHPICMYERKRVSEW